MQEQHKQLQALHATIAAKNLGTNPYTPLTMEGIDKLWEEVQALAKVRCTAGGPASPHVPTHRDRWTNAG